MTFPGPDERRGPPLGRRQFLRHLLAAGVGAGAGAAAGVGVIVVGADRKLGGAAWAAPAASPPLPGAPPDKKDPSGVTVRPDDPAITAGMVEYPGVTSLIGYHAAPKGGEVYPGVLVLHDREGLTEHFKDIARRLAKAGYVALAPDLLSRAGGTEKLGDASKVQAALANIAGFQFLQDMNSSVLYLEARPLVAKNRVGAMGVGLGGSLVWFLLTQNHDIKAAVPISGGIPSVNSVPSITAAVLAIFGETERLDAKELTDFDAGMKKAGLAWSYKNEPKAGRGFFDDTKDGYVPDAAKDAWQLSLAWFTTYLGG